MMLSENYDDMEFWLPPQFLSEDEKCFNGGNKGFMSRDPFVGSPCDFVCSDLGSPVDSAVSSTDSDPNGDDYIMYLTRQMKNSSLQNSFRAPKTSNCHENKGLCGCAQGSSHGSPTGPLKPDSSPATWDLLYAAAGEVNKMRLNGEGLISALPRNLSPISAPLKNSNRDLGAQFNQSSYQHQIQIQQMEQVLKMKQLKQALWEEQLKLQNHHHSPTNNLTAQNRIVNHDFNGNNTTRQVNLSPTVWPPLQSPQQNQQLKRAGMRAVFLNPPAVKKECAGTGVFLPRRAGFQPESRKKPCSTALLPARVVQALNLNIVDISSQSPLQIQPRFNCNSSGETDVALKIRNMNLLLQQQAQQNRKILSQPAMSPELKLPQEWTY